jgi:hypothetical protein
LTSHLIPVADSIKSLDTYSIANLTRLFSLIFGREGLGLRTRSVVSGTTSLINRDAVVLADATAGNINLNLPYANSQGEDRSPILFIRRLDASANLVDLTPSGTDTINGVLIFTVPVSSGVVLVSDGNNGWWTI